MANQGDTQNDIAAHEGDYSFFTVLMKWGTIVSFVAAAIVVLIIAS